MFGMWWLLRVRRDNRKMYSKDVEMILVVGVLGEVPTFQLLAIRIVKCDITYDHIWIIGNFNPLFK